MGAVTTDDLETSTWELTKQNLVAYNITSGLFNEGLKFYHSQTSDDIIDIEQAKQQADWSNVDLDFEDEDNITREELGIMITDKRRENYRNFLANHKKDALSTDIADLGSSFVGQMLDPLAYLGGAGVLKGLHATSKLTRSPTALKKLMEGTAKNATLATNIKKGITLGAVAGTGESLLTEPLYYAMAQSRQEHYTLNDSLLNIAFGTIAGGVFGSVGGAISYKTRLKATQIALNQIEVGEEVNIIPLLKTDPVYRTQQALNELQENKTSLKNKDDPAELSKDAVALQDALDELTRKASVGKKGIPNDKEHKVTQTKTDLAKLDNINKKGSIDINDIPPSIMNRINKGGVLPNITNEILQGLRPRVKPNQSPVINEGGVLPKITNDILPRLKPDQPPAINKAVSKSSADKGDNAELNADEVVELESLEKEFKDNTELKQLSGMVAREEGAEIVDDVIGIIDDVVIAVRKCRL